MAHSWSFDHANTTENCFVCGICLKQVCFGKPGSGSEPTATPASWPANIDDYVGPCNTDKTADERLSAIESRLQAAGIP